MGVIIYGRRSYGRVHAHDGEYLETQFAHIDYVPLFPVGSQWITRDLGGGERRGFKVKLHGGSVAATYLRIWAPLLALGCLVQPGVIAKLFGAGFAALSVWAWTWRALRGHAATRRSDFNRVAFGTRCEPRWLTDEMRERLAADLRDQLAKRPNARPPEDVALHGPLDVEEAVLAYGMLRIAGVSDPASDAAADRLLASAFELPTSDGGPYRAANAEPTTAFGDAVAKLATAHSAQASAQNAAYREQRIAAERRRWFRRPWVQAVGLALLTPMAFGAIPIAAMAFGDPVPMTERQLGSGTIPHGRVVVTCDSFEDGHDTLVRGGEFEAYIYYCWIGKHVLPMFSPQGAPPVAHSPIVGTLYETRDDSERDHTWLAMLRRDAPTFEAYTFDVHLDRRHDDDRGLFAFFIALDALVLAGWIFWIRGVVRRRAARRSATVATAAA